MITVTINPPPARPLPPPTVTITMPLATAESLQSFLWAIGGDGSADAPFYISTSVDVPPGPSDRDAIMDLSHALDEAKVNPR